MTGQDYGEPRIGKGKTYPPDHTYWYLPIAILTLIGGAACEVVAWTGDSPWVGAIGAGIGLLVLAVLVIVGDLLW